MFSIIKSNMRNTRLNPLEILKEYQKIVFPEVQKYLIDPAYPNAYKIPKKYDSLRKLHWKIVSDYPNRMGKYLRPTLLILTAQAMGVNKKKAITAAAGMQISEDWILIHDDFEDNSEMRRGKPTLHRIYGNGLAINAGDCLHAVMWKVFRDTGKTLGEETENRILEEFYTQLARTTIGQTTEIYWAQNKNSKFSDNDWFFIADGKTSYYTIACPMRLGAIIAKASKSQLEKLAFFGIYLGRTFQLVDDILDITSSFGGLKKQKGNDIYEGKKTVLLGHLIRNANRIDLIKLKRILNKPREKKTQDEVDWIIEKMMEYKSIDYAKNMAGFYKRKALKMFELELTFLKEKEARKKLAILIHFVLERDH